MLNKDYIGIAIISVFLIVGCAEKEDEVVAYDCSPETFKRSTAIYDRLNSGIAFQFSYFVEDEEVIATTRDVPAWIKNETLVLNYSEERWNPDDIGWYNNFRGDVLEEGGECYRLQNLDINKTGCMMLNQVMFSSTSVRAIKIYRLLKGNYFLDYDFRDNYNPNYEVPDGYDYISTDYNLNRISRKLERKALITTSDNDKLIDEYTYQCSEKKISGDS